MNIVVIVSFICLLAVDTVYCESEKCNTPKNEAGECILITKCQILKDKLKNMNTENRKLLVQSGCGFEGFTAKVCCPLKEESLLPSDCGISSPDLVTSRIIDGYLAGEHEYPWMARIQRKGVKTRNPKGLHCGGALINNRYVLTAAHCTLKLNLPSRAEVVLGIWDIEEYRNTSVTVGIEKVIVHDNYDRNFTNDIALLRLERNVEFNRDVRPICLPTPETMPVNVGEMEVAGWGKTEFGSLSIVLRKITLKYFDDNRCQELFSGLGDKIGREHICAVGGDHRDTCGGDSGGALMAKNLDGRMAAYGLVSYGIGCGIQNWPAIYTRVGIYDSWIKNNLKP